MTEPVPAAEAPPADARMWASLCHLAAFVAFIGIPFGNILGPLVVWLIKRNDHPFVDHQGKEALNFQISVLLYGVLIGVLVVIALVADLAAGVFVVIAAGLVLLVLWIVAPIVAAVRCNRGIDYRYPATARLLR